MGMENIKTVMAQFSERLREYPHRVTVTEVAATWVPMLWDAIQRDEKVVEQVVTATSMG